MSLDRSGPNRSTPPGGGGFGADTSGSPGASRGADAGVSAAASRGGGFDDAARPPAQLDAEDLKLVTLARAARGRSYCPHTSVPIGAAVRDTDGRTYVGSVVECADERFSVSALQAAVVAAVGSGARRLEAAALVAADPSPTTADLAVLAEFGGASVVLAEPDGTVLRVRPAGA